MGSLPSLGGGHHKPDHRHPGAGLAGWGSRRKASPLQSPGYALHVRSLRPGTQAHCPGLMRLCAQLWALPRCLLQTILVRWARQLPPHPLPLSGPASLRPCPHCCGHRDLTTAASRAPGQVLHGRPGLCRGPDCWPGGAPRDPCWRNTGRAPVCSPGGTVLYRPFCLCNINTDFYTSALWLSVLSIVFGSLPSASTWSLAHGWSRWLTTILTASAFWEAQQTVVLHTPAEWPPLRPHCPCCHHWRVIPGVEGVGGGGPFLCPPHLCASQAFLLWPWRWGTAL